MKFKYYVNPQKNYNFLKKFLAFKNNYYLKYV